MIPLRFGETLEGLDKRIEFRQRLYTVEELREIYASVEMTFERVFHGNVRPKEPTENQFEIFAAARKPENRPQLSLKFLTSPTSCVTKSPPGR